MTRRVRVNGMNSLCTSPVTHQSARMACCYKTSGSLLEELDGLEHFVHMAGHLQAAPFLLEHAIGADEERAALDALHLLAVHDLVLDHAEHVAHLLFGIGDELERKLELGLEVIV